MTTSYFSPVETWCLTEEALLDSLAEMARDGVRGNEGVVLWLGRREKGRADISHLVALRGPTVIKRPDLLLIDAAMLNDVTDVAIGLGVSLIGQIHTHGGSHGTDLSRTDRVGGVNVPYYLSVVAPDFGLRAGTHISDCGVHVFEPDFGYRRLSRPEIARRVHVVSGARVPLVTVGDAAAEGDLDR